MSGAVFGTPVVRVVFALEMLAVGKVRYDALVCALGTRDYLGLGAWSPSPADATILGFFSP